MLILKGNAATEPTANGHAVMRLSHPQGTAEPGDRELFNEAEEEERLWWLYLSSG